MSAIASGGLFGNGPDNGWLKNVGAANTDLVFGMAAEELGMIIAVLAVICIVIFSLFTVKAAATSRSTFYTIAVYFGAAGIKRTRYAVPAALCADLAGFFFCQPHGAAVLRVSGNRGRIVVQWQASRAKPSLPP